VDKDVSASGHTSAEDAGRVAQAAGVKTLVLSHFVPADDPLVTDQMWIDAARAHFQGAVVVGKEFMEIWGRPMRLMGR
jgi:ribonuclease BN (tRNA processing enzyme)